MAVVLACTARIVILSHCRRTGDSSIAPSNPQAKHRFQARNWNEQPAVRISSKALRRSRTASVVSCRSFAPHPERYIIQRKFGLIQLIRLRLNSPQIVVPANRCGQWQADTLGSPPGVRHRIRAGCAAQSRPFHAGQIRTLFACGCVSFGFVFRNHFYQSNDVPIHLGQVLRGNPYFAVDGSAHLCSGYRARNSFRTANRVT